MTELIMSLFWTMVRADKFLAARAGPGCRVGGGALYNADLSTVEVIKTWMYVISDGSTEGWGSVSQMCAVRRPQYTSTPRKSQIIVNLTSGFRLDLKSVVVIEQGISPVDHWNSMSLCWLAQTWGYYIIQSTAVPLILTVPGLFRKEAFIYLFIFPWCVELSNYTWYPYTQNTSAVSAQWRDYFAETPWRHHVKEFIKTTPRDYCAETGSYKSMHSKTVRKICQDRFDLRIGLFLVRYRCWNADHLWSR